MIRVIQAPGCIANSKILRFYAILRRCRLGRLTHTTAKPFITTSSTTTLPVMISLTSR